MINLLETTLYVSVTALFILLFKQIFKNKLSAKWHVLIWLLLAVRLVLPSLPESSFSVFNAFDIPEKATGLKTESHRNPIITEIPDAEKQGSSIVYKPSHLPTDNTSAVLPEIQPAYSQSASKTGTEGIALKTAVPMEISVDFYVDLVWGTGAGILLLYFAAIYAVNLARVKKHKKSTDNGTLLLLDECKSIVGTKKNISLVHYGASPMLMGIFKPIIVLPDGYSESENRNIIIHELCHQKNGDIYSIWLAVIVLCLNWFNPIIWLCFFVFRRDIEVYCDRRVLEYTANKKEYASLLVKTALKRNSFIAGTTSLQNGEKEVERRIKYMAYFKKPKVVMTIVIAVIAVIISVICLTNAKSSEKDTAKKQEAIYLNEFFPHNDGDVIAYTGEFLFEEIKPFDGEVQVEQIKNTDDGTIYCLSILNPGIDLTDNFMANPDCSKIYFKVTEDEIYLYENGSTTLIMSTKTDEKTDFSELSNNGTTSIYRYHNTAVETGYYESFVFEKGIGLTEYKRGYGAGRDHIELKMKNSRIIESTPNFFLKQTITDEDEAYYYEVYDNNGNILLSDTSARCPVFNHLDGSLYELRRSLGTFAWHSIYINVEPGYISEPYDNPFYLINGVIAYVYDIDTFTDDGKHKTGEITFIGLYDLYKKENINIDAEFLKESSVTYQIEYEDNTHIAVTYYTENGQKENRKIIEVPPLSGTVSYNNREQGENIPSLPINSEIKLLYASGAGAWGDYLHINPDGSFSGEYHDSDMGIADENKYPQGTVFIDRYSGKYGNFIKIDDYTYLLTVLEETHEFEPNAEWIEDGIRFVSTSPENPDTGTEYVLCLPGKPLSEIPQSVKEWEMSPDSENTLSGYCLYPEKSPGIGYFEYS